MNGWRRGNRLNSVSHANSVAWSTTRESHSCSPERKPTDFADTVTFHLTPPAGRSFTTFGVHFGTDLHAPQRMFSRHLPL